MKGLFLKNILLLGAAMIFFGTSCKTRPIGNGYVRVVHIGEIRRYGSNTFDVADVCRCVKGDVNISLTHISNRSGYHTMKLRIENNTSHSIVCMYRTTDFKLGNTIYKSPIVLSGSVEEMDVKFQDETADLFSDQLVEAPEKEGWVFITAIKIIPLVFDHLESVSFENLKNDPVNYANRYLRVCGWLSFGPSGLGFLGDSYSELDPSVSSFLSVESSILPRTSVDCRIYATVAGLCSGCFDVPTSSIQLSHISHVELFPRRASAERDPMGRNPVVNERVRPPKSSF